MKHFDKHSISIKALVDVSEAMLNAMEPHGIDPETVANKNEFTVLIHFLKMLRFPCVVGPYSTKTHQRPSVFGHPALEKYDSTMVFEGQNAELR